MSLEAYWLAVSFGMGMGAGVTLALVFIRRSLLAYMQTEFAALAAAHPGKLPRHFTRDWPHVVSRIDELYRADRALVEALSDQRALSARIARSLDSDVVER